MAEVSTVLLVHGAWANASSWSKVIPLIENAGLAAIAVQMPLTALEDDVAAVRRAIALEAGPVLLAGHSYGGVVITEAGAERNVAGLVYVAAFAPDVGQSAASVGAGGEPPPMNSEIRPDPEGFLKLTHAGVHDDFAQDLPEAERRLLFATQAPTAAKALGGVVSIAAWKTKPSWYLVATEDRAIQPDLERSMAKQIGAQAVSVPASHLAMLSHPDDVAKMIIEAAAQVGGYRKPGSQT